MKGEDSPVGFAGVWPVDEGRSRDDSIITPFTTFFSRPPYSSPGSFEPGRARARAHDRDVDRTGTVPVPVSELNLTWAFLT